MRGTVNAKALGNATKLVQGISQTKISNPIVENTVIRVEEDHIDVLATNLSVSIRVRLAAESTEVGEAALPAKLLAQVVGVLPDAPVSITKKGNEVILESGRNRFKINSLSTEDFPPFVPEVEGPVPWRSPPQWPARPWKELSSLVPRSVRAINSGESSSSMRVARFFGWRPMDGVSPR